MLGLSLFCTAPSFHVKNEVREIAESVVHNPRKEEVLPCRTFSPEEMSGNFMLCWTWVPAGAPDLFTEDYPLIPKKWSVQRDLVSLTT